MQDIRARLAALRRPPLLIRAARHGATEYRRDRHLRRLLGLGAEPLPGPGPALLQLLEEEAALDEARQSAQGYYPLLRHVEVMIAIMGEAESFNARPDADRAPVQVHDPNPSAMPRPRDRARPCSA